MIYALLIGNPTYTHVKDPLKVAKAIKQNSVIGLDIETGFIGAVPYKKKKDKETGLIRDVIDYTTLSPVTGDIRVISIYLPSIRATVTLTDEDIKSGPVLDALLTHLQDGDRVTSIHNALYEGLWFRSKYGVMIENSFCTQLGHQIKTAGLAFLLNRVYGGSNTLKVAVKRCLGVDISKTEQSSNWSGVLTDSQLIYSMLDPYWSYRLYLKLRDVLDTKAGSAEMGSIAVFIELNHRGIPADIQRLQNLELGYANAASAYSVRIMTMVNDLLARYPDLVGSMMPKSLPKSKRADWQPNLNSPAQVKTLLNFERALAGKPLITSTAANVLETLNTPVPLALTRYRTLTKLGQYASKFISNYNPVTKRVSCTYTILAPTGTGRSSAKNGSLQIVSNTSPLLAEHNLTGLKSAFTASVLDGNMVMLKADFAASHLNLAASFSRDTLLNYCTENDLKVHYFTLEKILMLEGNPMTFNEIKTVIGGKVKTHPRYYELVQKYTLAKNVIYSFLNFSGSKTLQSTFAKKGVHISIEDCKLYLAACKDAYKELWDYMRGLARVAEQGLTKTFDLPDSDSEARAIAPVYGLELSQLKPVFLGITTARTMPDGRVIKLPAIKKKQEDSYMSFYGLDAPDVYTSHAAQYVACGWLSVEATILKKSARIIRELFKANPVWKAQIVGFAHDELPIICDMAYYTEVAEAISNTFESCFREFAPIYKGDAIEMLSDWETLLK